MKKRVMILGVLLLISAPAFGEEKGGFWDKLQCKLDKVTPSKKISTTTAVGGVRGAKNDDASDIYWKGRDKALDMNDEELAKFTLALESKRKGESELALKQFEEFLELYPQSQFRVEGLQACEMIRVDMAAAKASVKTEAVPKPAVSVESVPVAVAQPAEASKPTAEPAEANKPASEPQPAK